MKKYIKRALKGIKSDESDDISQSTWDKTSLEQLCGKKRTLEELYQGKQATKMSSNDQSIN